MTTKLVIELFSTSYCQRCVSAKQQLQQLVEEINANNKSLNLVYREIDVVENIDYAVQVGVLTTPSIAINSSLVFSQIPSMKALKEKITATHVIVKLHSSKNTP
ncbi:MAG: thioredoxin family protein [Colwellia sp.]|nr:thioredoxin family protein [Colwellia sp.]